MNQFMKHATLPTIYTEIYFSVWAQAMQCLLSEVNDNFDNLSNSYERNKKKPQINNTWSHEKSDVLPIQKWTKITYNIDTLDDMWDDIKWILKKKKVESKAKNEEIK